MLPADLPDTDGVIELMDARSDASVTIALGSSPLPQDHERIKIALRDAVDDAERRLADIDLAHGVAQEVVDALTSVITDDEFWEHQSQAVVIFASPGTLESFRIPDAVSDAVFVGDRFDLAPMLRALASARRAFIVQLSEGMARLTEIGAGTGLTEHKLRLSGDRHGMLEHAANHGDRDRDRAQGATGDRTERERFCRTVQDEVRALAAGAPLILNVTPELEAAYRAVNTHPVLLAESISANPESLDDQRLETEARAILDRREVAEIAEWKERFGTLRAQDLATSKLSEVAAAAAAAAIEELRFNVDASEGGTIDEFGRVSRDDSDSAPRLVDELAARVLHTGGRIRGVSSADLLDGSPVAATLRFPVGSTA